MVTVLIEYLQSKNAELNYKAWQKWITQWIATAYKLLSVASISSADHHTVWEWHYIERYKASLWKQFHAVNV